MSNEIKVSDPDTNWNNDHLQFARIISELVGAGLSEGTIHDLSVSMDLSHDEVWCIINRACDAWDTVREQL